MGENGCYNSKDLFSYGSMYKRYEWNSKYYCIYLLNLDKMTCNLLLKMLVQIHHFMFYSHLNVPAYKIKCQTCKIFY